MRMREDSTGSAHEMLWHIELLAIPQLVTKLKPKGHLLLASCMDALRTPNLTVHTKRERNAKGKEQIQ